MAKNTSEVEEGTLEIGMGMFFCFAFKRPFVSDGLSVELYS